MIIHRSPFPDVEIPEVPITEYVLRGADIYPDRAALIDGPSGRTYTFAELRDRDPPIRRRAGGARLQARRHARTDGTQPARVRDRLPRRRRGRRHGDHDQPDLRRRGGALPAPGRRRIDAGHDRHVRRDGEGGDRGHERHRGADARRRRGHRQRDGSARRADRAGPGRRPRGRRRAPLLVGHDRSAERRDAHALQPRRQHRPGAPDLRPPRARGDALVPPVLPHLRHAGADEHGTLDGRHDRDDAAVRPPAGARARADLQGDALLRRAAGGAGARQASDRRAVRHVERRPDLLRRRPARRRARRRGRGPREVRCRPGLRHDRAQPGQPCHAGGHVQARHVRHHRSRTPRSGSSTPPPARTAASARRASCGCAGRR